MMPPYISVKVRWTTTPANTCPTLYEEEKSPTDLLHVQGPVRRGLQFISSLSEKTRKSNRLQILLQRQQLLLSYLKTLSLGPAGV